MLGLQTRTLTVGSCSENLKDTALLRSCHLRETLLRAR